MADFAPKGEEVLRTEALEDLGFDTYEGNEEVVDRVVARLTSAEEFKASLHKDKMSNRDKLKETRKLAGLDPETGEKLQTNVVVEPKETGFTAKDVKAIQDLQEEDVDFVLSEAKLRGLSVSETKALPIVKSALKMMAEERKTAEATNTGTQRSRNNFNSDEAILKDFEKGVVSDSQEDIERLVLAQQKARLAAAKLS